MTAPTWRQMGFLTPDAPDAQREVWALSSLLRRRLGETLEALASQTAEPTWQRTLEEQAARALELALALGEEAGPETSQAVADDDLVRDLDGSVCEVVASGHAASLLTAGFAVLGEQAVAPIALLDDVAGPHAKALTSRMIAAEHHLILGRLASIVPFSPADATALKRMLRHLHGQLAAVNESMRQTWHTLGVDGENMSEASRDAARRSLGSLGLKVSHHDLGVFGHG